MNGPIEKTITLLKRAYDQPIIFHLLFIHLDSLLAKASVLAASFQDEWASVLVQSCTQTTLPNQGLETKLVGLLKKIRPPHETKESKLKTVIICYYLLNRPANLINHMLLFELVNNFLGFSDHLDGLILSIFAKAVTAQVYGRPENTKLRDTAIEEMVRRVRQTKMGLAAKVKALACFIKSNETPFSLEELDVQANFFGFKCLEYICFYARYTADPSHVKKIISGYPDFLDSLSRYMQGEFGFIQDKLSLENCVVENKEIYEKIKLAFNGAQDKAKFVRELSDFIMGLK